MIRLLPLLVAVALAAEPYAPQTRKGVDAYNQAVEALDRSQPKAAEAAAKKCLKAEPDRGMCQVMLAEAWSRLGRADEAVALLEQVLAAHPTSPAPAVVLALVQFSAQRFPEADAASAQALALAPTDLDALAMRQTVLLRLGRYDDMLAHLQAARAAGDLPDYDCLEAVLRLQREHADAARPLLVRCRTAARPQLIANAEAAFTAATGEKTEGADALVDLLDEKEDPLGQAMAAYNAQAFVDAEGWAGKAIDRAETATAGRVLRALARYELGKRDAALADLDDALRTTTWIDVHRSGVLSGIITKRAEEVFLAQLGEGAALRILLLCEAGRVAEARQALPGAREAFGDLPALSAAEAFVLRAEGDAAGAWASAAKALSADPPPAMGDRAASILALEALGAAAPADRATAERRGSLTTRFNLAAGLSNGGDAVGCLAVSRPLVGSGDSVVERAPDAPEELASLQGRINAVAHGCAALAGDLDAALLWWPLLGAPAEAPAPNAINHALLLLQRGRAEDAWTALNEAQAIDRVEGTNRAAAVQIAVGAAIDTKRWDDVEALCQRPEAPPTTRLSGATALGGAGRKRAAVAILEGTCGELSGEARGVCTNNLRAFGG